MIANSRSLPALAALLLPALLVACSRPAPPPEPVRAVRTLTLGVDTAAGTLEFAAEVRPRTESRLGFRVGGKLVSRTAEVGQAVRAGQTLARLDAGDLQLGAQAAQAAASAAQASLALATAELRRYQDLRAQGFISALELDRRETAWKAQQAQLEQAQAQAALQRNQAGHAQLVAALAGVVTAVEAEPGAVLAAGTPVLRLAHDGPRDVVFSVPEDGVASVRQLLGRKGAIQVRPWGAQATWPATVREVAAAADATTRTFLVKADVAAAPLQLGQTATVSIALPERAGVQRLPLSAVMHQQGQTVVWLLDRDSMTVRRQPVVVGGADANSLIVGAGLSPGQVVVSAGVHTLTEGQKVRLFDAPAYPPPREVRGSPAAAAAAEPAAPGASAAMR